RQYQLEAALALISGQDSLVDVGTGYGKTLCMVLPALYSGGVSVIVTPLKRLQVVQVAQMERFGLKAVAINEDTPNDRALWKV
ncbi:hypothetical protein BKA70DRAFT_1085122, partial [Coprinopsis sp. MPI-PUGE-AT-0042]